ncbi:sodium:solute symporter family protein [Natranaerobius thermophilus]|uniref:Na+/solute symporter n=1 Tax=Natranaerobius thermophilus (strain ATCC BAA-1301 / DSM 18059 / JW/NM-WN-LF) TaxID=457570 RepID=B2A7M0_NATTJ|nr:sodium:solute symporter family protein [Natranaerobius thermophilus]ACB85729.1 Na+/solute symporter [Natranaerobius thermophilus JW/NM-WN-LF]
MLSITHIVSILFTLILVTAVGIYSASRVNSASDFSVGGRSISASLIIGTIVGTLVGGAATIGTAQLAFTDGFSAWWFTLGGGLTCIFMGTFLAKPLRQAEVDTIPGFLASFYGQKARPIASTFSSMGIFLNVVGQTLAAVALITSMVNISSMLAAIIAVFLIIVYVIFGGVWGTGLVGRLKVILLYISLVAAGLAAFYYIGGTVGIAENFHPLEMNREWYSLFNRGINTDLAAGFSMFVGVLSTQTYLQAVFSGKNIATSIKGSVISGIIIPPIGLLAMLVGLFMRVSHPTIEPRSALPLFVINYLPDWIGGIVLATLLISIIGTGAGLILGISTMLSQDLYKKLINPSASQKKVLLFTRSAIILFSTLTLLFVTGNLQSLILNWSFLSMGLRGATICIPLLGAIFLKDYINPKAGLVALFLAPLITIIWAIMPQATIDPLYIGLGVSLLTVLFGSIFK